MIQKNKIQRALKKRNKLKQTGTSRKCAKKRCTRVWIWRLVLTGSLSCRLLAFHFQCKINWTDKTTCDRQLLSRLFFKIIFADDIMISLRILSLPDRMVKQTDYIKVNMKRYITRAHSWHQLENRGFSYRAHIYIYIVLIVSKLTIYAQNLSVFLIYFIEIWSHYECKIVSKWTGENRCANAW